MVLGLDNSFKVVDFWVGLKLVQILGLEWWLLKKISNLYTPVTCCVICVHCSLAHKDICLNVLVIRKTKHVINLKEIFMIYFVGTTENQGEFAKKY